MPYNSPDSSCDATKEATPQSAGINISGPQHLRRDLCGERRLETCLSCFMARKPGGHGSAVLAGALCHRPEGRSPLPSLPPSPFFSWWVEIS